MDRPEHRGTAQYQNGTSGTHAGTLAYEVHRDKAEEEALVAEKHYHLMPAAANA